MVTRIQQTLQAIGSAQSLKRHHNTSCAQSLIESKTTITLAVLSLLQKGHHYTNSTQSLIEHYYTNPAQSLIERKGTITLAVQSPIERALDHTHNTQLINHTLICGSTDFNEDYISKSESNYHISTRISLTAFQYNNNGLCYNHLTKNITILYNNPGYKKSF